MAVTRAAMVIVAVSMWVLVLPGPIDAATGDPPDCVRACDHGGGGVDGDNLWSDVRQFEPGGSGGATVPTGSSYLADCVWGQVEAGETRYLHPIAGAWEVEFDEPHWLVWCAPFTVVYTFFPIGDPPPQWVIDEMIGDAYSRTPVKYFNPRTSPDGTDDIAIVVQTPTFLWVDEDEWNQTVSATASLPVGVVPPAISVTTTAQPYRATWTGADAPTSIECLGPGQPYRFGIGGDEAQDDTCSFVFTRDSTVVPDRRIGVSVNWEVSYSCQPVGFCAGGPLPDIITRSDRPIVVTEIQAVET